MNFLFVLHSYAASDSLETQTPNSSTQLASVIVLLIYYGFGLIVAYRYYQTGLLIVCLLKFSNDLEEEMSMFSMQYLDSPHLF